MSFDAITQACHNRSLGLINGAIDRLLACCDAVQGDAFPAALVSHCEAKLGSLQTAQAKAAFAELRRAQANDVEIAWIVSASSIVRELSTRP